MNQSLAHANSERLFVGTFTERSDSNLTARRTGRARKRRRHFSRRAARAGERER